MKILVIRLSSFGDIVLTYTFLEELRKAYPDSEISYLTRARYADLIRMNRNVDNVLEYIDNTLFSTIVNVYKNKYDIVFDLHKNIKSYLLSFSAINNVKRLKKDTFKKALLVMFKVNMLKNFKPVYKKFIETLDNGYNTLNYSFRVISGFIPGERIFPGRYAVIAPSSRHFTKRLPKEKFEEIINSMNDFQFILTGDDSVEDTQICNYLSRKCKNTTNVRGKLSFKELSDVIYYSDFVICNDSGILHLAEALGKKVTVFFGSTVKEFGFFPQLRSTDAREVTGLDCRPCTRIGRNKCPKKHFSCMNKQSISNLYTYN